MKTIREIKEELQAASGTEREKLLELYREDTRSGVVRIRTGYILYCNKIGRAHV